MQWVESRDITRVGGSVVGGAGVRNPICKGGRMQRHGVEGIHEGLLIPRPCPRMPGQCGRPGLYGVLLLMKETGVDRNRRQWRGRGRADLTWYVAEGWNSGYHSLRGTLGLLSEAPWTRPHLN
jgi:hypothetical protein